MGDRRPSSRDMVPGFGAAVRARREELGQSLAELAAAAGTHPTSLSKLENEARAPSLRLGLAIARALGVSVYELVPGEAPEPSPRKGRGKK